MNKIVLITGATSGFGEACAHVFAEGQFDVIITGRRKERLDLLKKEIEKKYGVRCLSLPFDVRQKEEVNNAINSIPEDFKAIDVLVNNAGLALGRDLFDEANIEDWDNMIDTNVKGLLYVSKAVIPLMKEYKKGQVINIGSVAAKEVYERGNVYCATKSAVEAISKAMRIDLLRYGIKVTAIHPGAADTEFSTVRFKGDQTAAKKVYEGYQPLTATDVANVVFYAATLPPHVCVNDLVVTCLQQANAHYLYKG